MQHSESGVSELISAVLAVILVIALAAVIGAIFLGWAVPLQKTPYIATQAIRVDITNASAVRLFLSQGETVSLAPATSSGLPVKFSLTNGSATYDFFPLPGAALHGWKPGDSIYLFRNTTGSWVADSTASVKNNTGFSNGTWTVNIVDAKSDILVAQHTVNLSGNGVVPTPVTPVPTTTVSPVYANRLWLNAQGKPGTLVGGKYMKFRYTGYSGQYYTNGWIQFPGEKIEFQNGDLVKLEINGNQGSGNLDMNNNQITTLTFNIKVYQNANPVPVKTGTPTAIFIEQFDSYESTLAFTLPSMAGQTYLEADGKTIINYYPPDSHAITITNIGQYQGSNSYIRLPTSEVRGSGYYQIIS